MDCEKFDHVLMDLLYAELDELTHASAHRHAVQCQRCRGVFAGMRATRDVGTLPPIDPPSDLETRILDAERQVRHDLPFRARIGRTLTIAAGYAMRPQLAMAALLLLMIGSSLLLLRPRPTPGPNARVHVTEHGTPTPEGELIVSLSPSGEATVASPVATAVSVASAEPRPVVPVVPGVPPTHVAVAEQDEVDRARAEADDRAYAAAMESFRAGYHSRAVEQFDAIVKDSGKNAPAAELYGALAAEQASGCAAALPRFDSVSAGNVNSSLGHQATWHSATCRAQLGHNRRALLDFQKLLLVPAYQQRARQALAQLAQVPEVAALKDRTAPAAAVPTPRSAVAASKALSPATSKAEHAAPATPAPGATTTPRSQTATKKRKPARGKQSIKKE
jgi:hypothetical protein